MAQASDTRGARRALAAALASERAADVFPLNDLPNDVLVSVFAAAEDPTWVRHTFPLVCRGWNELYRSKDASPLHETLVVDDFQEEEEDVDPSRVISWAQRRAGSVRKLRISKLDLNREAYKAFCATDLGALVAAVGPSLTDISIDHYSSWLCERPFWESLRTSVVPFGRLRSFFLILRHRPLTSELEVLGQLAGSLEELVVEELSFTCDDHGLPRFPVSFCALKKLRRLVLIGHPIKAIPAEISSLKKLEALDLRCCRVSSLPKELGELSGLTKLELSGNRELGTALPAAEAFPAELGKMKSLRELSLDGCCLSAVPAFVGELESLEVLDLSDDGEMQIDAPLDFLIERCPLLRMIQLKKVDRRPLSPYVVPWTPASLAHLRAFEAKLRAKNPDAKVVYK